MLRLVGRAAIPWLALVLAVPACGPSRESPAHEVVVRVPLLHDASIPWPARADSIDAQRERLGPTRRGSFAAGDQETRWIAYLIGEHPIKVEARMDQGEYGATDFDYFPDPSAGALVFVRERGLRVRTDAEGRPVRDSIRVEAAFDTTGRVLTSWQTVNGAATPLTGSDLDALRRHYETIRTALR